MQGSASTLLVPIYNYEDCGSGNSGNFHYLQVERIIPIQEDISVVLPKVSEYGPLILLFSGILIIF